MTTLPQDIAEIRANRAQRICAPGKWRVWRDGNTVKCEIFKPLEPRDSLNQHISESASAAFKVSICQSY